MSPNTFTFMAQLRAANPYWYQTLLNCAKYSPLVASRCVKEARKHLDYIELPEVNTFDLCKAANRNELDEHKFIGISTRAWELRCNYVINTFIQGGNL